MDLDWSLSSQKLLMCVYSVSVSVYLGKCFDQVLAFDEALSTPVIGASNERNTRPSTSLGLLTTLDMAFKGAGYIGAGRTQSM